MPYPNYPQYQPYMQPYPQYTQPYQQMQQPINTMQQTQTQAATYTTMPQVLNGKFVDSIESVKATDVMMDGSVMYFPATDGKTIYTKQLQGDGTSRILTFALVDQSQDTEKQPSVSEIIDGRFKAFRDDIFSGFDEINDRFDKIERQLKPKNTRGGKDE